jgi:hypothetical protein
MNPTGIRGFEEEDGLFSDGFTGDPVPEEADYVVVSKSILDTVESVVYSGAGAEGTKSATPKWRSGRSF